MASQTITTSLNWDHSSIAALADGDGVTINGGTLVQNSDSRFSFQGAVINGQTFDNTNGGTYLLDGTTVWWLPYSGGSGTVPARRAIDDNPVLVSQAATGATGELLAVFAELGVRETPPGQPLPGSGYLKLRSHAGVFDASALSFSGCTATATGPGQRGWLQAVFRESNFATVSASGLWKATGDWFELGATSGERGQSFRYYVDDYCPAIWIETAPGSGTYESWSDCGTDRWESATVTIPTDSRGKFFSCLVAGGVSTIRIAGSTCGYLPPAGCRVRVPNLHISAAPTSDASLNGAPNTNATSRWRWNNGVGPIELSHCSFSNVHLAFSQLWRITIENCGWYNNLLLDRIAAPLQIDNCCNGQRYDYSSGTIIFELTNILVGGTISNCRFTRYSLSNTQVAVQLTGCKGLAFNNVEFRAHSRSASDATQRPNTSTPFFRLDSLAGCTFNGLRLLGSVLGVYSGCSNLTFNNTAYGDRMIGSTDNVQAVNAIRCENATAITIDGFCWYDNLPNVNCAEAIARVKLIDGFSVQNIGSPSQRLDMGSSYAADAVVASLSGMTNCTYRRIYVANARNRPINGYKGADFGVLSENVWGDAADNAWIASGNVAVRGAYGARPVTGSLPDVTPFGSHLLDGFDSESTGWLAIMATNRTSDLLSAAAITITGGSPVMNTFGWFFDSPADELVISWPWRIRGHTGFAAIAPTLLQSNAPLYSFDVDTGSGYSGSWTELSATNLAAVSGIDPQQGFLFKLRIQGPASGNATFRGLCLSTTTDATAQQVQYPDQLVNLTLTGLQDGTEVRVLDADLKIIGGVESSEGGSFTAQIEPQTVAVAVHALRYQAIRYEQLVVQQDTTLLVQQQPDRQYANP